MAVLLYCRWFLVRRAAVKSGIEDKWLLSFNVPLAEQRAGRDQGERPA